MLVLTRKKDEQIRIGDDIIITVIRVKGKSVRIGIQAPRTEPVLRGELEFRDRPDASVPETSSETTECEEAQVFEARIPRRIPRRPLRDYLKAAVGAPGE